MSDKELNIRMAWLDELKPIAQTRLDAWKVHLKMQGNMRVGALAHYLSEQPLDSVLVMLAVAIKAQAELNDEPDIDVQAFCAERDALGYQAVPVNKAEMKRPAGYTHTG